MARLGLEKMKTRNSSFGNAILSTTRNKRFMLAEIAILLCSMLLAATLPAIAAGQIANTAEDEFTLGVYGNANEDDIIDMRDSTYIKLVIFGKKPATTLADANYDEKISMLDVGQTKLIILGKEKKLTIIDQADRTVTVNMPVERVVTLFPSVMRIIVHLGAVDKIVGVSERTHNYGENMVAVTAYPELEELTCAGNYNDPNLETLVTLKPDVIFMYGGASDVADATQEKVGIPVVCLNPSPTGGEFSAPGGPFDTWRLAGIALGEKERVRAEELISYCNEEIEKVSEITSEIPVSEKPTVYFCHAHSASDITRAVTSYDPLNLAGGINMAAEIRPDSGSVVMDISKEQIIKWNPDIILIHSFSKEPTLSIEKVLSDPTLQTVNAVKDKEINYTKGWYIGWDPATGLTECFYMGKLFHPTVFKDLDVEEEGNEILERFYGVDDLYTWILERGNYYTWD